MAVRLPEDKNPDSQRGPFEVLGLPRNATAAEIRDAQEERIEEINDAGYDDEERVRKRDEVRKANERLRDPKERLAVQMFFFDSSIGKEECRMAAEKYSEMEFEFSRILEGTADVLSTEPDVREVSKQFRDIQFDSSVQIKTECEQLRSDIEVEAMESVAFDR